MKVVIAGGSGHIGTLLGSGFASRGVEVVILSRQRRPPAPSPLRTVWWDGVSIGDWQRQIDGSDVVINLAGRSVNCRYTPAARQEILQSRVRSTRAIGDAIARCARPPRLWLQASTATIYSHRFDGPNDEYTGTLGGAESNAPSAWHFSTDVARAWESALNEAPVPHTRKVVMRSAMTMGPEAGGVFDTLACLTRRGLGGRAGNGHQFVSWIHEHDFVAAISFLIDRDDLSGVVNIASPNPLPNAEFMRVLREACGVRLGIPASRWMLEVGAAVMQTETELILKSRRVKPARLLDHGFCFAYPEWREAARELCNRWLRLRELPRVA